MMILPTAQLPSTPEMTWSSGESSTTSGSTRRIFRDLIQCLDNKDDVDSLFDNLPSPLEAANQIPARASHGYGNPRGTPRELGRARGQRQQEKASIKHLGMPHAPGQLHVSSTPSVSSRQLYRNCSAYPRDDNNLDIRQPSSQPGVTDSTVIYVNVEQKVEYVDRNDQEPCPHERKCPCPSVCLYKSGLMDENRGVHLEPSDADDDIFAPAIPPLYVGEHQQQEDLQCVGDWHTDCQLSPSIHASASKNTNAHALLQRTKHESLLAAVDVSFNTE